MHDWAALEPSVAIVLEGGNLAETLLSVQLLGAMISFVGGAGCVWCATVMVHQKMCARKHEIATGI